MLPGNNIIDENLLVKNIVARDYRTADVFRKYGIDFCCGGNQTLVAACMCRGLNIDEVKNELQLAMRNFCVSNILEFDKWPIDFLTDYIMYVHHGYLKNVLPLIHEQLKNFVAEHQKKFPYLTVLLQIFNKLYKEVFPHMRMEEEVFFPYIKQIAHAFHSKAPYASLLVRTLRKPVENIMQRDHETVKKDLQHMRSLTNDYTPPEISCVLHKVNFSKLKELDDDLVQHIHLENNILFPKALIMEKELLLRRD